MNFQSLINDIETKYAEHFDMAGDKAPALMNQILSQMVLKERNEKQFYKDLATQKQRERRYENHSN